ncbi:MAG: hypothetical protein LBS11_07235 [Oscillospiraceae bacterium]|jgi:hypothetical protein|nr:hypothetical protein [Oscillospiraceae bacterium]
MSGISHQGEWMENSGTRCPKRGGMVYGQREWVCLPSGSNWENVSNYYCPVCMDTLSNPTESIEDEQIIHFIIGYYAWVNGQQMKIIHMKDNLGKPLVFNNEVDAEGYILYRPVPSQA